MSKTAIENYGVSRKKFSGPVDDHVEDLGTSSMSCFNWLFVDNEELCGPGRHVRIGRREPNSFFCGQSQSHSAGGDSREYMCKLDVYKETEAEAEWNEETEFPEYVLVREEN